MLTFGNKNLIEYKIGLRAWEWEVGRRGDGNFGLVLVGLSEEVTFELGPFQDKGKPGLQRYWD